MTQALALSMLQTGVQIILPAGRALPEFDMAMAVGPTLTPAPAPALTLMTASVSSVAPVVKDMAVDIPIQNAPATIMLSQVVTATPALVTRTPVEVAQLLSGNEATGEAARPATFMASPTASASSVAPVVKDMAVDIPIQNAPASMALSQVVTATPALVTRIPVEVAQLLSENEATGESAHPETSMASSTATNIIRTGATDEVLRRSAIPEQQTAQPLPTGDKKPATIADDEALLTDENKDEATTENPVANPDDVRVPVSVSAPPTVVIIALPMAEKAAVPASPRTAPTRVRGESSKIDATLSPAKPRNAVLDRRMPNVQTANSAEEDAPATTAQPLTIEPNAKSVAFESALTFSNTATSSSDVRAVAAPPANGLYQLSSAHGVADRHLNLARDSMWLDQLATDIVSASNRTDHISFRLMPAHLGQLDIDLVTSDAGLSVNIAATTEEAGQIVAAQQPSLIESLQAQGVRVADTHVTSGNDMSRQHQPQRQNAAHHLIETAFSGADEPTDLNHQLSDGRFA